MKKTVFGFCLILSFFSCQKVRDYLSENRPPQDAEFSIVHSDASCAIVETHGELMVGISADSVSISIKVNVTRTGNWEYSTDTVNGFYFSGKGSFSAQGVNNLLLKGHGTPIAAGNTELILDENNPGCTYTYAVLSNDEPDVTGAKYYYKAKVDGVWYSVKVLDTSYMEPYGALAVTAFGGSNDSLSYVSGVGGSFLLPEGVPALTIQKFSLITDSVTEEQFVGFLAPGTYDYIKYSEGATRNGIILYWASASGEGYTSYYEEKSQDEDSHFEIISAVPGTRLNQLGLMVKMKFNCKIFANVGGRQRTITDGEMVGFFAKGG